eukprot:gene8680-biopygen9185
MMDKGQCIRSGLIVPGRPRIVARPCPGKIHMLDGALRLLGLMRADDVIVDTVPNSRIKLCCPKLVPSLGHVSRWRGLQSRAPVAGIAVSGDQV